MPPRSAQSSQSRVGNQFASDVYASDPYKQMDPLSHVGSDMQRRTLTRSPFPQSTEINSHLRINQVAGQVIPRGFAQAVTTKFRTDWLPNLQRQMTNAVIHVDLIDTNTWLFRTVHISPMYHDRCADHLAHIISDIAKNNFGFELTFSKRRAPELGTRAPVQTIRNMHPLGFSRS